MARPQRFDTRYCTISGVLWIYAETYFTLVRLSDGLTKTIQYSDIGL